MATISEALQIAIQHHQAGRLQAAEEIYRQILQADPTHADALHLLGVTAHQAGRHEAAAELIARAVAIRPDVPAYRNNLGDVYRALGRSNDAIACYRCAIEIKPDSPEPHYNLGNVLREVGRSSDAVAAYRRALQLKPNYPEANSNLGNALFEQGHVADAIGCYQRALELWPGYANAQNNLGNALKDQGRSDEAIACYRRAIELRPDFAEAHSNLGLAFQGQGKLDEAVACYRRAFELKPDYTAAHSNLLFAFQYRASVTRSELAAAHAEYDRLHAAPLRTHWPRHENVRDPRRRLRVGFVSPDLAGHPVGYFLIRVLENLDRGQCETVCYCDRILKDDMTIRLQAAATIWRDMWSCSNEDLAKQILADRIDILFDLTGHTARNRLPVLRKPAPIQITWIGYEGTTGLQAMDYLLADRYMVPPEARPYYAEKVLRLPNGYVCYDPPQHAPSVGPLPAQTRGWVTFGSFNNPAKITPDVVAVWAAILRQVPRARLVLKYRGMDNGTVRRRYEELFAAQGIAPDRLDLQGWSPYDQMLAEYKEIDIALDPFPFTGSATTCEALWMGVPVITCPGETFASRHGLSHLSNIGLTELIAKDLDEYVELAVALANDLPRLAALRAGLRARMAASPLCDGKRFADNLMSLLRGIWQQWCET